MENYVMLSIKELHDKKRRFQGYLLNDITMIASMVNIELIEHQKQVINDTIASLIELQKQINLENDINALVDYGIEQCK